MKPKKFEKKLVLKKKTIAHLSNEEMKNLNGVGGTSKILICAITGCGLFTCYQTCPDTNCLLCE